MADAHGSGPCDSNIMRVQVPSSARRLKSKDLSLFCLVESSDGTSHHQFARSVQYASRSSLPSIPFTAIPSPIKLQTWIVASGKPFESCKHSHRQPSAAQRRHPLRQRTAPARLRAWTAQSHESDFLLVFRKAFPKATNIPITSPTQRRRPLRQHTAPVRLRTWTA